MEDVVLVEGLGGRVAVEMGAPMMPSERAALQRAWASATAAEEAPSDRVLRIGYGSAGATAEVWAPGFEQLAALLTTRVTLALLEQAAGRCLLLHAAALADHRGRVVAMVGASGAGKTTLARELGARMHYVTDESVAVDIDTGAVHAYRKPLSLIEDPDLPKQQRSPDDLGLAPLPDAPLSLGRIAVLDRRPVGSTPAPVLEPLPLLDALVALVPQMSHLGVLDRPLAQIASWLDRTGGAVRVRYEEARQLDGALSALLEPPTAQPDARWRRLDATGSSEGIAFGDVDDAIAVDDRLAVLMPGRLQVLDGIALAVCDAVSTGRAIVPYVLEVHGPPLSGDAETAVASAVDALVGAGVLRAG